MRNSVLTLAGSVVLVLASACTTTVTSTNNEDAGTLPDTSTSGFPDNFVAPDTSTGVPDTFVAVDSNVPGVDAAMACSPVAQTGCQASQKCTIDNTGNAACAADPATPVATGLQCGTANTDDCAAGNLCASDMQGSTSLCEEFCATDADCKQAAVPAGATQEPNNVGHCAIGLTGSSYMLCTVACNPVSNAGASGCPAGLACEVGATSTVTELSSCRTPGTVAVGVACSQAAQCAAGLECVGTSAAALFCREVCRAGTNTDCTGASAGDTCESSSSIASPMFGVCCPAAGC